MGVGVRAFPLLLSLLACGGANTRKPETFHAFCAVLSGANIDALTKHIDASSGVILEVPHYRAQVCSANDLSAELREQGLKTIGTLKAVDERKLVCDFSDSIGSFRTQFRREKVFTIQNVAFGVGDLADEASFSKNACHLRKSLNRSSTRSLLIFDASTNNSKMLCGDEAQRAFEKYRKQAQSGGAAICDASHCGFRDISHVFDFVFDSDTNSFWAVGKWRLENEWDTVDYEKFDSILKTFKQTSCELERRD